MSSRHPTMCIVTPIWRERLAPEEQWCVHTTERSAAAQHRLFAAPKSLDVSWYRENFPKRRYWHVDDCVLESVSSYNAWVLSPDFYRALSSFDFVVICQSDAVILREPALSEDPPWDYVGAPWTPPIRVTIWRGRARLGRFWSRIGRHRLEVGNGGLSIRRVVAFTRFTEALVQLGVHDQLASAHEDIVVSALGPRHGLQVASKEAAELLFVEKGAVGITELPDVLGAHALARWNPLLFERLMTGE